MLGRFKLTIDTPENYTSYNPTLLDGELILVRQTDGTVKMKVGDGVKKYTELDYLTSGDEEVSIPENVLTADSPLDATKLTGTVPSASLPSNLLTTESSISANKITGMVPAENLPDTMLTSNSPINAENITGNIDVSALPEFVVIDGGDHEMLNRTF